MRKKSHSSDPVERELQRETAKAVKRSEDGRMPGEARGKGQLRNADKPAEDEGEPVLMFRDDVQMQVAPRDVEAHRRQGFRVMNDEAQKDVVVSE